MQCHINGFASHLTWQRTRRGATRRTGFGEGAQREAVNGLRTCMIINQLLEEVVIPVT